MPWQRKLYPEDWHEITARIRARAGDACEQCFVPNGEFIVRMGESNWRIVRENQIDALEQDGEHVTRIVLTVAHHPDPNPMNCADENLLCLCQRCHNRLDNPMRCQHAAQTRRKKKVEAGQLELL